MSMEPSDMLAEGPVMSGLGGENKRATLQRLQGRHLKIMDFYLQGLQVKDIALAMDMTREAVGLIVNSPVFQEKLAERRLRQERQVDAVIAQRADNIQEMLELSKRRAMEVMQEAMEDQDTKTRIVAAKDILDRAGVGVKQGTTLVSAQITQDKLDVLILALQESRLLMPPKAEQSALPLTEQNAA